MEDFRAFRWGKSNIDKIKDLAIVQTMGTAIDQGVDIRLVQGQSWLGQVRWSNYPRLHPPPRDLQSLKWVAP